MKKVIFVSLVITVLVIKGVAFSAELKSKLFVYNSFYDLMRGDLWDYIKDQQILLDVEAYPKNFVIIGLGNTNQSYSIGEMMATGTVGLPRFLWISPQYPNKVVEIWDREFPFAAIEDEGDPLRRPFPRLVPYPQGGGWSHSRGRG